MREPLPFQEWYESIEQKILDQSPSLLQEEVTLKGDGSDVHLIDFGDFPPYLSKKIYALVITPITIGTRVVKEHDGNFTNGPVEETEENYVTFRVDILLKARGSNRLSVIKPKQIATKFEEGALMFLGDLKNDLFKNPLNLEAIPICKILAIDKEAQTITIGPDNEEDWS